ncbi:hypothetical protein NC651_007508 [Populus alba x Populus x berolinensis]|nr:hypothetical protein NC651_007508 [Populus alba x Populus x berolinensis]
MGIGWLLQIRKTWPALGHQQSLELKSGPGQKWEERRGNKEKDELVKLHYLLLFSWKWSRNGYTM